MEKELSKKETAIDKLFSVIEDFLEISPDNPLFKTLMEAKPRLKEIEKEQIIEAYKQRINDSPMEREDDPQEYYKLIYGNK